LLLRQGAQELNRFVPRPVITSIVNVSTKLVRMFFAYPSNGRAHIHRQQGISAALSKSVIFRR